MSSFGEEPELSREVAGFLYKLKFPLLYLKVLHCSGVEKRPELIPIVDQIKLTRKRGSQKVSSVLFDDDGGFLENHIFLGRCCSYCTQNILPAATLYVKLRSCCQYYGLASM